MGKVFRIVKHAVTDFGKDDCMSLGAALAFYTALSIAPLLVLVLAIAGFVWNESDVHAELLRQAQSLIGEQGAEGIKEILEAGGKEQAHGMAAITSVIMLVVGATGVFAQLQYSLNKVWNVTPRPGATGVWGFIRKRLLSLGMVLAVAFLLLVSLVVTAALGWVATSSRVNLPGADALWNLLNFVVSFVVYTGVFTAIQRYLPDVKLTWRQSIMGGLVTAALFAVGKELLGWYVGRASVASPYGAAGSFFVVLLWVYYSSLILFIGAELTEAMVLEAGQKPPPEGHAEVDDPTQKRPSPPKPEPVGAR